MRRFFLFDTCSGITGTTFKDCFAPENTKYVRYAKEVRLVVELDPNPDRPEKILRPYLKVSYEEKAKDLIIKSGKDRTTVEMVYLMDYFAEQSGYWYTVMILIIITAIMTFLSIIFRGYAWCQRNPSRLLNKGAKPTHTKKCCVNISWLFFD